MELKLKFHLQKPKYRNNRINLGQWQWDILQQKCFGMIWFLRIVTLAQDGQEEKKFHKVWLLCLCIKVFKILISLFVKHLTLHCQYNAGCQASSESQDRDKVWSYTKCANLVRSRTADWEPGEWTGHITSSQPQLWPPICVLYSHIQSSILVLYFIRIYIFYKDCSSLSCCLPYQVELK